MLCLASLWFVVKAILHRSQFFKRLKELDLLGPVVSASVSVSEGMSLYCHYP